jgi:flavin-dependent dehydrogenase
MSSNIEVGVIGAGPAGARVAELLAGMGAEVVLLDAKAPWEKPCGGGLTPAAFDDFPDLHELDSVARTVCVVRVELTPESGCSVHLERPLRIVSRRQLGAWQLERAERAGVKHLSTRVRSVARLPRGGWALETDLGRLEVGFLVGADGAASLVRRVAAPGFAIELAPTRVAYPDSAGPTPELAVLKFYPSVAGYLWDFPRLDHRSLGVMMQRGSWNRPALDAEVDAYHRSSEPSHSSEPDRAGAVIGTAQLGHGDFTDIAGPDFALLGDAAGFADPLTGEGIHNAIRSAAVFARAWAADAGRSFPDLARAAFEREFAVARMVRRVMLESELGSGLISHSLESNLAYAGVHAILNALNEHDGSVGRIVASGYRAWRATRADRNRPARGARRPLPRDGHAPADAARSESSPGFRASA